MSGVGGYVRRCEHGTVGPVELYNRAYRAMLSQLPGYPVFEMFYQAMPILHFETFDVKDDIEPVDSPGIEVLRSDYERTHTF